MFRKIDADKDLWASGFKYVLVELWKNQIATRKLSSLLQIEIWRLILLYVLVQVKQQWEITTPQLQWSTRFARIRWIASIFDFNTAPQTDDDHMQKLCNGQNNTSMFSARELQIFTLYKTAPQKKKLLHLKNNSEKVIWTRGVLCTFFKWRWMKKRLKKQITRFNEKRSSIQERKISGMAWPPQGFTDRRGRQRLSTKSQVLML